MHATECMSEDNLCELVLSFHHLCSGDETPVRSGLTVSALPPSHLGDLQVGHTNDKVSSILKSALKLDYRG